MKSDYELIVIGASAGGLEALKTIFSMLLMPFQLAIIIVQHMLSPSENYLVKILNENCRIPVMEVEAKDVITTGNVYVAPPNYHVLIENDNTFSLSISEKINYARPSIDVLFETAAEVYRDKAVGIILTGANSDGSAGLKKIIDYGGFAIAQDPKTAEVPIMPLTAIKRVQVDLILSLVEIGKFLNELSAQKMKRV